MKYPVCQFRLLAGLLAMIPTLCAHAQAAPAAAKQPAAAAPAAGPFPVRGFHVCLRQPMSTYTELLGQLAERGYNTVILGLNERSFSPFKMTKPGVIELKGYTFAEIQEWIRQARALQLEPILELKMIGKQQTSLGELARKLPGLLRATNGQPGQVLNPNYVLPDGRDVFQAIVFPEIDRFIGLYGKEKPKYLLLGIDEFEVEDLEYFAKQKGTTAAALFADTLNRITGHVLAQGVTPIIWGDMLLSKKLAEAGHGVAGFEPDPRMKAHYHQHAEYESKSGVSVLTAMNGLRQRDRIIVADWQYGSSATGDYPTVDYFQKLGFQDVWGTTWLNLKGAQDFSRYAARKGCGGMIASTWNTQFSAGSKHHYPVILNNSIIYFKNPAFTPPDEKISLTASAAGVAATAQPPIFSRATKKVVFRAALPAGVVPREPVLAWRDSAGRQPEQRFPMTYLSQEHQLEALVTLPDMADSQPVMFDTTVKFTCEGSGWYVQDFRRNGFVLMEELPPPPGSAPSNAWFHADFTGLPAAAFENQILRAGGKYGGLIVIRPPPKPGVASPAGALACDWTAAAYAVPPAELWDAIYDQGLRLRVEFRLDAPVKKTVYSALVSYGGFWNGFRVLMNRNKQVLLQIGGGTEGGRQTAITFPQRVTIGRWTSLEMVLSPPDQQKQRTVTLRVGDAAPVVVPLATDLSKSSSPLGLGSEFSAWGTGNLAKLSWQLFPGQIRKVEMSPYRAADPHPPK